VHYVPPVLSGRWLWLAHLAFLLDVNKLQRDLEDDGATGPHDLVGLNALEAQSNWFALANLPLATVERVLVGAQEEINRIRRVAKAASTAPAQSADVLPEITSTDVRQFATMMAVIRHVRAGGTMPSTSVLAQILRCVSATSAALVTSRWVMCAGSAPPTLPHQRANWLQCMPRTLRDSVLTMLEEDAIWLELGQWRKSAAQYASAVQLWGRAASLIQSDAWPPCQRVLEVFVFFFRNGDSLANYISHLRSVLTVLRSPLGILENTTGMLEGARKLTPLSCRRVRQRASAEQTRRLAHAATCELLRSDVGESWVVARHFCLRYGAEVVPLEGNGSHSKIDIIAPTGEAGRQVSITLYDRKLQKQPVVVFRRCICKLQGRTLCGVCVLARRWEHGRVFPAVCYTSGLGLLKAAASLVGLPQPFSWGTHAFRRGWADEALKAGGPSALFYSGGWRGVAAFGYVDAKSRGAMLAAEWLVDHSDSSDYEL
jgi:hypothetical protein